MRAATLILLLGVLPILAAGCMQDRLTRPNFETLYRGMPDYAVERKLGRPTERSESRWVYVGRMPYRRAEITFERDARGRWVVNDMTWRYDRPGEAP